MKLPSAVAARSRSFLLCGVAAAGLAWSPAAFAQQEEEAQPAPDMAEVTDGNEIVVTATKREQTLQEVPVAVSVTTAETIERAQIRDIKDLQSLVPSLRVNTLQSAANTNFFIRGFGNGANNAGIEPSVGLFVDGVYRSRSASMISDLPDVQRVEVLRGPQSTLFGKNASAGVISLVTREPQFDFGGNVEASYGDYNALVLKGVVTGPISDTIAASLAGGYNRRDGMVKDLRTGSDINDRNRWFVRGQLLFKPSSDLKVRLIGDYSKIDELCCAVVNVRAAAPTQIVRLLGGNVNPASNPFGDVVYNNIDSTNDIENWGVSGQIDYNVGPLKLTSITAYRRTDALTNQDSDFTSADLLGRNSQDLRINTFTQEFRVSTDWDGPVNALLGAFYFNEKIDQSNQLLFGTQFRPYANALITGQSGGQFTLPQVETLLGALSGNPALYTNQFFATGQGFNERYKLKNEAFSVFGQIDFEVAPGLTITGGINYTKDKKTFSTNTTSSDVFSAIPLANFVQPAANLFAAQTVAAQLGFPGGRTIANQADFGTYVGTFGAGALAAVQTATLNTAQQLIGLRALQFLPPFLNVPNALETGKVSDGDFSFTARVAYDVTDQINVYASYATGYKGASVNLSRDSRPNAATFATIQSNPTYSALRLNNLTSGSRFAGPEDATVYEAGLKANWGIASANVAVFKQSIRGFQSNLFTGTGFFLANAGKQSTFGIEFEGMVQPAKGLTLNLAVTYLDAKYDSFPLTGLPGVDLTGTRPSGVPPISFTIGGQYEHELGNGDRIILRGDYHHESAFQLAEGFPNLVVRNPLTGAVIDTSAALAAGREFKQEVDDVNASLTYAMANGVELTVWGRNLLNDRYLLNVFDSPAQIGSISGYPNQPRTWGGSVRYRF